MTLTLITSICANPIILYLHIIDVKFFIILNHGRKIDFSIDINFRRCPIKAKQGVIRFTNNDSFKNNVHCLVVIIDLVLLLYIRELPRHPLIYMIN
jgi:hypothetical protein